MSLWTPVGVNGQPVPIPYLGAAQNVTFNAAGGSSAQSTAFGANTVAIMVSFGTGNVVTAVRVATGTNPTAAATSTNLPSPGCYFIAVSGGDKAAFISDDANGGNVSVTELKSLG